MDDAGLHDGPFRGQAPSLLLNNDSDVPSLSFNRLIRTTADRVPRTADRVPRTAGPGCGLVHDGGFVLGIGEDPVVKFRAITC